jgi:nicotinamidase-related amidase
MSNDEMLDNIMLYWLTNTGASSARLYFESFATDFSRQQLDMPVAVSVFPGETFQPPKIWGERTHSKLVYWNVAAHGWHFAAFEQPDLFVAELRNSLASVDRIGWRSAPAHQCSLGKGHVMQASPKVGLEALLTPDNCVLVLIDHQPFQLANVNSHEPTMVMNNVTALAKTAKAFNIPTILTTVNEQRGGLIFKTVQDVFPNQPTINRTFINAWEDQRVVDAVKKTGRKKLVIAALWSEMCLAMPGLHAMGDGYDVYVVTDASGGVSREAHDMAIRRLVAAGAQPITWLGMAGELQRDWARIGRTEEIVQLFFDHAGAAGSVLAWEMQLLQAK